MPHLQALWGLNENFLLFNHIAYEQGSPQRLPKIAFGGRSRKAFRETALCGANYNSHNYPASTKIPESVRKLRRYREENDGGANVYGSISNFPLPRIALLNASASRSRATRLGERPPV